MGDGAGEVGFTDAGRPGDEDIEVVVNEAAAGQLVDEGFIETAARTIVEVFEGGGELELGASQSIGELSVGT